MQESVYANLYIVFVNSSNTSAYGIKHYALWGTNLSIKIIQTVFSVDMFI